MTNMPAFIAIDLFCGGGGTTCGLLQAGGLVVAGVDSDSGCEVTYSANNSNARFDYPSPKFLLRDLSAQGAVDESKRTLRLLLANAAKQFPGTPTLLAISAPCQPFSKLAQTPKSETKHASREASRNLLLESLTFVRALKPDLIFSENVAGISKPAYGDVLRQFQLALLEMGYGVDSQIVCASRFGIPQYRRRSITLAAYGLQPSVPPCDPDAREVTVYEAIGHLPSLVAGGVDPTIPNHRCRDLSETNLRRLSSVAPGESNGKLFNTPHGNLTLKCHREAGEKAAAPCFTDVYTRMSPDRPSPTITTKCHSISNGRFGHFDTRQGRGISVHEAALLQSFPANYVFHPTHHLDPCARMVGNAVPPKLASFFSRYLALLTASAHEAAS